MFALQERVCEGVDKKKKGGIEWERKGGAIITCSLEHAKKEMN